MSRWKILAPGYLLTVPLPALIVQAAGVSLEFEKLGFWLVQIYTFPLWIISEAFGVLPLVLTTILYWAALAFIIGAWLDRRGERLGSD